MGANNIARSIPKKYEKPRPKMIINQACFRENILPHGFSFLDPILSAKWAETPRETKYTSIIPINFSILSEPENKTPQTTKETHIPV